jgi:hypothetical protein
MFFVLTMPFLQGFKPTYNAVLRFSSGYFQCRIKNWCNLFLNFTELFVASPKKFLERLLNLIVFFVLDSQI